MLNVAALVGVMLLPTLLGFAVIGVARLWRRRERRPTGPLPAAMPIERLAADLRRLNTERGALVGQPRGPGRSVRARALHAAYADVLTAACYALEVTPPRVSGSARAAAIEIDRVEAELLDRGLDVGRGAAD